MFYCKRLHIGELGGMKMAKCPDCGKDVKSPKKTWKMAGKPDKAR
jgi:adenine-specific DNA methylase